MIAGINAAKRRTYSLSPCIPASSYPHPWLTLGALGTHGIGITQGTTLLDSNTDSFGPRLAVYSPILSAHLNHPNICSLETTTGVLGADRDRGDSSGAVCTFFASTDNLSEPFPKYKPSAINNSPGTTLVCPSSIHTSPYST
ncbi:hypothetical protein B0O80DRAFT_436645 [Mortierella sp. GBAus27b]|nr:hypothetical protein B0O80DRAFT_436645 [Mortierella sp. GBAus27b]